MVSTASETERLLEEGRVLELGLMAARQRTQKIAGFIEDDAVALCLGQKSEADSTPENLRWVHYHPAAGEGLEVALEQLKRLRETYPQAWLHGFSPAWLKEHGNLDALIQAGLDSLSLFTGELDADDQSWKEFLQAPLPLVASFVYKPEFNPEKLLARLETLRQGPTVKTLVPLAAAVGDRILLPGVTTEGTQDVSVLAACRLLAPGLHVRSSWAVTGWKVAQVGLAFGADELAGWGTEEYLAYSHRVRPAARVNRAELLAGIDEAGFDSKEIKRCDWAY